jgi:hypothetical protein
LGLGIASKPVDVATFAAPTRLAGHPSIAVLPFKKLITHSFLATAYAETGRSQDAEGERAIIMRLSPFLMHGFSPDNSQEVREPLLEAQEGRISVNATAFARHR